MKKLPFHSILAMVCILSLNANANAHGRFEKDSTQKIIHSIDGIVAEWTAEKFEKDPISGIFSAADHDANNFYLALKISDQQTQMKLATLGMNLFIDKKGKKKESTGIEFPVKKEGSATVNMGRPPTGEQANATGTGNKPQPVDMNALHDKMAGLMFLIKTFGFEGQDDKTHFFAMQTGISIAFDWDEANNMNLEYLIPLSYLGDQKALQDKPVSIGWVINGMPEPSAGFSAPVTGAGGGGGGRGGGSARNTFAATQSSGNTQSAAENSRFKQQSYWTKYTFHF